MKLDAAPLSAPEDGRAPAPQRSFRDALEARARPRTEPRLPPRAAVRIPALPLAARPSPAVAVALAAQGRLASEGLRRARGGHDAEVARLGEVRSEGLGATAQLQEARTRELLRQALVGAAPPGEPPPPAAVPSQTRREVAPGEVASPPPAGGRSEGAGLQGAGAAGEDARVARAEALLALVERVEAFVRAGRPALALELHGAVAGQVELERTGPGEVAVTLRPRGTRPAAAELEALRRAVEARGLRLSRLTLGPGGEPSGGP